MTQAYLDHVNATLSGIAADGMMKQERMITSPQSGEITVGGRQVINLCANNYLGLAVHPDLIAAARDAMDPKGFGMASVRFICGTQDIHRELEQKLARGITSRQVCSQLTSSWTTAPGHRPPS